MLCCGACWQTEGLWRLCAVLSRGLMHLLDGCWLGSAIGAAAGCHAHTLTLYTLSCEADGVTISVDCTTSTKSPLPYLSPPALLRRSAPELLLGEPCDTKADVYSFGRCCEQCCGWCRTRLQTQHAFVAQIALVRD